MSVPPALIRIIAKVADGVIWTVGYQITSYLVDGVKAGISRLRGGK